MICQDDTFRTFRVGGLNCFFFTAWTPCHATSATVASTLFSSSKQSWATECHATSAGRGICVTFLGPDASGSSIFFVKCYVWVAVKLLQLSKSFCFHPSWRDASTSSPTLELQVSFYFVEPKILTSTYNCCYIVVFFRKNLWDWKTPGQSNEKLPTRGWGSKNITLRLPRSWPRGAKPGFQLIFLIIGSLVDDLTCCKPLIVAWLEDFNLPSRASMLVIWGIYSWLNLADRIRHLILFQQVLVDTVPTRCISILMANVLPCTSPLQHVCDSAQCKQILHHLYNLRQPHAWFVQWVGF